MSPTISDGAPAGNNLSPETISINFRKMEKQEWWLWSGAVAVTLLLTAGLASFLLPGLAGSKNDESTFLFMPQIVRGLLGLVLIFDIYTLYQQLKINTIRRKLVQREELFRLISENAADLIAVVDMQGNRIYNSLSYEKVLGIKKLIFFRTHSPRRQRTCQRGSCGSASHGGGPTDGVSHPPQERYMAGTGIHGKRDPKFQW
jgi:PAS domain-containing protein